MINNTNGIQAANGSTYCMPYEVEHLLKSYLGKYKIPRYSCLKKQYLYSEWSDGVLANDRYIYYLSQVDRCILKLDPKSGDSI